jgi:ribonuclease HII
LTRVAGIDEAGRGCAIGPLVIAGAVFRREDIPTLVEMGVKDSKKLTARKREALVSGIRDLALDVRYFDLAPATIDKVVLRNVKLRKLNYLEMMAMARVLRELEADEAYVDPSDVDPDRCNRQILRVLQRKPSLVCEVNADEKYPVTSAASILAKVRRDSIVAELRERYGDFNSGYMHDEKTVSFLEEWFSENRECPDFVRSSWAPVQRIMQRRT